MPVANKSGMFAKKKKHCKQCGTGTSKLERESCKRCRSRDWVDIHAEVVVPSCPFRAAGCSSELMRDNRGISVSGFRQCPGCAEADSVNGDWEWRGFDLSQGSSRYCRDRLWLYVDRDRRWRIAWSFAEDSRVARDEQGDVGPRTWD